MNGRHSGYSLMVGILVIVLLLACCPPEQRAVAAPVEHRDQGEQQVAYMEVAELLSHRQQRRYSFLAEWPADRLRRLQVWLELGIVFRGDWSSEELATVLRVLDAYGARYGEARFCEITDAALGLHFNTKGRHLAIARASGYRLPAGVWHNWAGEIVFKDGLFDDAFVEANYYWSFLLGEYAEPDPELTFRDVVIGHEFGHVVIDGLRAEATAAGYGEVSLEELYVRSIPKNQWPHGYACPNENLATELSVWALDVSRTAEVDSFRAEFLGTAVSNTGWPQNPVFHSAAVDAGR
ncbi:MAG: hypothetical protein ACP5JG_13465 [Anaerolineae bacterium]